MNNVVLIGLSGSGKTTLGRALAQELRMDFLDLDAEIEKRSGLTIREIFEGDGEERFRALEEEAAKRASVLARTVVSTGGGIVTRRESIDALRRSGTVVLLDRDPEQIIRDLDWETRPLLRDGPEALRTMAAARRHLYLAAADLVFDNNRENGVERLIRALAAAPQPGGYAVIGDPIDHTLSPVIHQKVFALCGREHSYGVAHVPRGEAAWFLARAKALELRGFNVCAPHKQAILPLLEQVDADAALSGGANTVVAEAGDYRGYNTDAEGLRLAIRRRGKDYRGSRVVVLGSGDTGRAIALHAARETAYRVVVLGRNPQAALDICKGARGMIPRANMISGDLSPEMLADATRDCDILISTIPDGNGPADLSFLRTMPGSALVCDLCYDPPQTALLRAARESGIATLNGLAMLIYQAVLADELYLGMELDREWFFEEVMDTVISHKQGGGAL